MESSAWINQDEISIREEQWKDRIGLFRRPPSRIPTDTWTDAPLLGNGDVGVSIGGEAHHQTFYIGKNDFWVQPHLGESEAQRIGRLLQDNGRRTGARIMTVGQISLLMPGLADASYDQEQDILNAETRGSFRNEQVNLRLCSWVSADSNVLVTELECMTGELDVTARLHAGDSATDEVYHYDNGERSGSGTLPIQAASRKFDAWLPHAVLSVRTRKTSGCFRMWKLPFRSGQENDWPL